MYLHDKNIDHDGSSMFQSTPYNKRLQKLDMDRSFLDKKEFKAIKTYEIREVVPGDICTPELLQLFLPINQNCFWDQAIYVARTLQNAPACV